MGSEQETDEELPNFFFRGMGNYLCNSFSWDTVEYATCHFCFLRAQLLQHSVRDTSLWTHSRQKPLTEIMGNRCAFAGNQKQTNKQKRTQ